MDKSVFKTILTSLTFLRLCGMKTMEYFSSTLDRMVTSFYGLSMDELEFVQVMTDLVDAQLSEAWVVGMQQNGLGVEDMTQEDTTRMSELIAEQTGQVFGFAEDIATQEGADHLSGENHLPGLLSRAQLWANAYQDMVNQAVLFTSDQKDKLKWTEGDTVVKCDECVALDGIVAPASVWQDLGVMPQNPPNSAITCGGWRCQCTLTPTDERATPNARDRIASITGR